jgi:hypothetical protein
MSRALFKEMITAAIRDMTKRGQPVDLARVKTTVGLIILDQVRVDIIDGFDAGAIPADAAEQILILIEKAREQRLGHKPSKGGGK